MAKIPKFVFDKRAISASRRMMDNAEKGLEKGLTKQQADALAKLAAARHQFHTNSDAVIKGLDSGDQAKKNLLDAIIEINEAKLPPLNGIPYNIISDHDGYIDIDAISELPDILGQEGVDWNFLDEYSRISDEVSKANSFIEKYLGEIDEKYGTSYKPTGTFRNF